MIEEHYADCNQVDSMARFMPAELRGRGSVLRLHPDLEMEESVENWLHCLESGDGFLEIMIHETGHILRFSLDDRPNPVH